METVYQLRQKEARAFAGGAFRAFYLQEARGAEGRTRRFAPLPLFRLQQFLEPLQQYGGLSPGGPSLGL